MRLALIWLMTIWACESKTLSPCAEGTERAESGMCQPVGQSDDPSSDNDSTPEDTGRTEGSDPDTGESRPGDGVTAQDEADALREAAEAFLNALDADQRDAGGAGR